MKMIYYNQNKVISLQMSNKDNSDTKSNCKKLKKINAYLKSEKGELNENILQTIRNMELNNVVIYDDISPSLKILKNLLNYQINFLELGTMYPQDEQGCIQAQDKLLNFIVNS